MVVPVTVNVDVSGPSGAEVSVSVRLSPAGRPDAEADRPGLEPPLRPDSADSAIGVDGPSLYWTSYDGAAGPVATSFGTTEKSRLLTSKK